MKDESDDKIMISNHQKTVYIRMNKPTLMGDREAIKSFISNLKLRGTGKVFIESKFYVDGDKNPTFKLELLPGTTLFFITGSEFVYTYQNPENPIEFSVCPKCTYYWKARKERPKQCPYCHKLLDKFNDRELSLASWMADHNGLEVTVSDEVVESEKTTPIRDKE